MGAVLFRNLCMEKIRKDYPGVKPRNDYDISSLSEKRFKGSPAEIYAQLDEDLALDVGDVGYEFIMEAATAMLDRYVEPTGVRALTCLSSSRTRFLTLVAGQTWTVRFPRRRRQLHICPPNS